MYGLMIFFGSRVILLLFNVGTPVTFPDGHKSFEKEVVIDETKRNRKGVVFRCEINKIP